VYVVAGVLHFIILELYVQIAPSIFPAAIMLVYLFGLAEIAVGIGLLISRTRPLAAGSTVALLVAIFPANIYMATHGLSSRECQAVAIRPSSYAGVDSPCRVC